MANDPDKALVLFRFVELVFKKLNHVARILSVVHKCPVPLVACLRVQADQSALCLHPLACTVIFISNRFSIVPPVVELFDFCVIQPELAVPTLVKFIYYWTGLNIAEFFNIIWIDVVVPHWRIKFNLIKVFLDRLCNRRHPTRHGCRIDVIFVKYIMDGVVARPDNQISCNIGLDES